MTTYPYAVFKNCPNLILLDCYSCSPYFDTTNTNLSTLVLRSTTLCSLSSIDDISMTQIAAGNGYVYVQDDLVEKYKSATNWSTYADQIKPLSEYIEEV